jgi:hypothetical protein
MQALGGFSPQALAMFSSVFISNGSNYMRIYFSVKMETAVIPHNSCRRAETSRIEQPEAGLESLPNQAQPRCR